jgi:hypothetical protein
MFIVIEGTDASGKSTLVDAVVSELTGQRSTAGAIQYHKGAPKEFTRKGVLSEYVEDIQDFNWFSATAVADRWHWGEVTYAPIKRRHTNIDGFGLLGVAGWRWTEMFLRARGITQFWLYQPLEIIQQRIRERGDDFVEEHELEHILSLYSYAFDNTMSCIKLQPSNGGLDQVANLARDVISYAKTLQSEVQHLERFTWYIGSPKPKALLVGDERNDETDTMLPFKPSGANSADYLLNVFVNAHSTKIYIQFFRILNMLGDFTTPIKQSTVAQSIASQTETHRSTRHGFFADGNSHRRRSKRLR